MTFQEKAFAGPDVEQQDTPTPCESLATAFNSQK